MTSNLNVITGATGLLGSHIAEQLVHRGDKVRALVRPSSDVHFLQELGIEIMTVNLTDLNSLRRGFRGAGVVFHCAAKVGDWGRWRQFQIEVIDTTRLFLEACRLEQVERVLYVSSIMVYGHPPGDGPAITETAPLGVHLRRWEYYARSKLAAEELCHQYPEPVTIIRPSWIYGPRDRNSLPRMLNALRSGRTGLIGDGNHLLNIVYAGDVAEGAILAATTPGAVGQAYNLSSPGEITQREWLDTLTEALDYPPVRKRLSPRLAHAVGLFSEIVGRLIFLRRPPYVTRYGVALVTRPTNYSTEKAARELGWQLRTPAREGLRHSLEWLQNQSPHSSLRSLS
jgi:nucleoside-diphosphate-sugar epimerase